MLLSLETHTAINKLFVEPFMKIRSDWNWEADFWKDTSNAYLWNTEATKHILDEASLPFPIFLLPLDMIRETMVNSSLLKILYCIVVYLLIHES